MDKTNFDKMSKSFKEAKQSFKDYKSDFQALEKPIETSKITQEMAQLSQFMQKNSGASKEWLNQLESCYAVLKQLSTQGNVMNSEFEPIKATIREIEAKMRQAGQTGISMWDRIGRSLKSQIAQQAAMYLSLQDFIRYFRTAFQTIRDLDYALVDLRKTTTMSANDLNQFYLDANESAKKYGVTTKEIIDQASSWSRLGFSSKDEATKMAEMSSKFTLISPGMDTQQSMDGLVSTMKAYGIEVADVEKEIMDKVNIIGNTAATSNQEIVDMLTRSSAAMAEANNSLEDTIALETAAVEITRNAETTGTAFKTVAMRLRGYNEETEELDDGLKNIKGDIADLTKTASSPNGISIYSDESTKELKSTRELLGEIADVYDQLTDKQQAKICLNVQKCA